MSEGSSVSSSTMAAVAVAALLIAVAALVVPFVSPYNASSNQVVSLQSQVSQMQNEIASLPTVNQPPTTRVITLEWEATLPSLQDRFFPQQITINQGDSIFLTIEINDTDGAHTFELLAPTGPNGANQLTLINMSYTGQWMYHPPAEANPWNGIEDTGVGTNCELMGVAVPCGISTNLPDGQCSSSSCTIAGGCSINGGPLGPCTGSWMLQKNQTEIAEIQTQLTLGPFTAPGVYRYFCIYHQEIGMIGWLIVQPNTGYVPSSSAASAITPSVLLSDARLWTTDVTHA